jgi:hypothetical protein
MGKSQITCVQGLCFHSLVTSFMVIEIDLVSNELPDRDDLRLNM